MESTDLTISILTIWAIIYLVITFLSFRRQMAGEHLARYLSAYASLSFVGGLIRVINVQFGLTYADSKLLASLPTLGVLLLAVLFMLFSADLLSQGRYRLAWAAAGGVWFFIMFVFAVAPLAPGSIDQQWQLAQLGLAVGWVALAGRTGWMTFMAYRQAKQPLHRNRIVYWGIALAFISLGDVLQLAGVGLGGASLCLAGVLVATYVVLTHNLMDLLQMGQRTLSFLITALVGVAAYTFGFAAIQAIFRDVPGYDAILAGVILAFILVVLVNPFLGWMSRNLNRLLFGTGYDPNAIMREYSQSISNIVDLELLAKTSLDLIARSLTSANGALFLVDEEKENEVAFFKLEVVKHHEDVDLPDGRLLASGPLAVFLSQSRRPLVQYDVDMLMRFKTMPIRELRWLVGLNMDVYVPIYTQAGWKGLLALGSKRSGERYFEADLDLLATLAEQTAVALQNARLFADLARLNEDLVRTQHALEQANRQLIEADQLKSSFIGVVTHELRTPFANVAFSLQLLEMYSRERFSPAQAEQFDQLKAGIEAARRMVDNLVNFAAFLTQKAELRLARLDMAVIIKDILAQLAAMADVKGVILAYKPIGDLPPVDGDRRLLSDAIYQLIHNAIKFTPPEGSVTVRSWATPTALYFDVKDTGIGVPADKLAQMWQGFNQIADAVQRGAEGLGLGLALVKLIATAHGGEVWAESREGAGSNFGFCVPLAGPEEQAT
jgi:signal transduction histidine kinase